MTFSTPIWVVISSCRTYRLEAYIRTYRLVERRSSTRGILDSFCWILRGKESIKGNLRLNYSTICGLKASIQHIPRVLVHPRVRLRHSTIFTPPPSRGGGGGDAIVRFMLALNFVKFAVSMCPACQVLIDSAYDVTRDVFKPDWRM